MLHLAGEEEEVCVFISKHHDGGRRGTELLGVETARHVAGIINGEFSFDQKKRGVGRVRERKSQER